NKQKLNSVLDIPIIDKSDNMLLYTDEYEMFIAIGDNDVREKIYMKLFKYNAEIAKLIHPDAVIGKNVHIVVGTVIMAGVIVNSYTKIGRCCIINTAASIDHDNNIDDFVHISPGVH